MPPWSMIIAVTSALQTSSAPWLPRSEQMCIYTVRQRTKQALYWAQERLNEVSMLSIEYKARHQNVLGCEGYVRETNIKVSVFTKIINKEFKNAIFFTSQKKKTCNSSRRTSFLLFTFLCSISPLLSYQSKTFCIHKIKRIMDVKKFMRGVWVLIQADKWQ